MPLREEFNRKAYLLSGPPSATTDVRTLSLHIYKHKLPYAGPFWTQCGQWVPYQWACCLVSQAILSHAYDCNLLCRQCPLDGDNIAEIESGPHAEPGHHGRIFGIQAVIFERYIPFAYKMAFGKKACRNLVHNLFRTFGVVLFFMVWASTLWSN